MGRQPYFSVEKVFLRNTLLNANSCHIKENNLTVYSFLVNISSLKKILSKHLIIEATYTYIVEDDRSLFMNECSPGNQATGSIVEIHLLVYQYFVDILPENWYFLLAFYRYFRENLNSVIILGPCWQP